MHPAEGQDTKKIIDETAHTVASKLSQGNKEAATLKFQDFPSQANFRKWKLNFKKKVAGASGRPVKTMRWLTEIEKALNMEDLEEGDNDPFESLSAKVAAGLSDIFQGDLERQVAVIEARLEQEGKLLNGRQMAWLMYNHFRIHKVDKGIAEFEDFLYLELKGDNLAKFWHEWEMLYLAAEKLPEPEVLLSFFRRQLEKSKQLEGPLDLLRQDFIYKGVEPTYDQLVTLVKFHLDEQRVKKNRQQRNAQHGQQRAFAAGEKAPKKKTGTCWQYQKNGTCVNGENCSFVHDSDTAAPRKRGRSSTPGPKKGKAKGDGKGKSSSQKGGKSPARDKSNRPKRGKSPKGTEDRIPCKDHRKGQCKKGDACDFWHPKPCRYFKRGMCDAGNNCVFIHDKSAAPAAATEPAGEPQPKQTPKKQPKAKPKATGTAQLAQAMICSALVFGAAQGVGSTCLFPCQAVTQSYGRGVNQTVLPSACGRLMLPIKWHDAVEQHEQYRQVNPCSGYECQESGHNYLIPNEQQEGYFSAKRTEHKKNEERARQQAWRLGQAVNSLPKDEQEHFFAKPASEEQERTFLVDSGSTFHLIAWKSLTQKERKSVRKVADPLTLNTANGAVLAEYVVKVWIAQLERLVEAFILKNVPPVLSLGKLCIEDKLTFVWRFCKHPAPYLQDETTGKYWRLDIRANCPIVVCDALVAAEAADCVPAPVQSEVPEDVFEIHEYDTRHGFEPADGPPGVPPEAGGDTVPEAGGDSKLKVKKVRSRKKAKKWHGPQPAKKSTVHNEFTHFPKCDKCPICQQTKVRHGTCTKMMEPLSLTGYQSPRSSVTASPVITRF